MSDPIDTSDFARYLRQRADLGLDEIFLEGLTRDEVLEVVAEARRGAASAAARVTASDSAGEMDADFVAAAASESSSRVLSQSERPGSRNPGYEATPSGQDKPGTEEISAPEVDLTVLNYHELESVAGSCEACQLAQGRTQVVFSDGNPQARLMVVGEAPGANEDRTGVPFVGQAGKFLDLLLAAVDLSRKDSVYICNVLKCRPPGNRDPMSDEIERCSPFLKRQIALVAPEVILAVGTFAAQLLTGANRPLGKLRGSVYAYEGVPLVVTYHPAALLRNAGWTRSTWDDLQLLRQVMDGS